MFSVRLSIELIIDRQRFFLSSGCFLVDYKLVTVTDMHVCEQTMLWQIGVYISNVRDLIKWQTTG
jgi:hypothetical protein